MLHGRGKSFLAGAVIFGTLVGCGGGQGTATSTTGTDTNARPSGPPASGSPTTPSTPNTPSSGTPVSVASSYPVVDTGQTRCYNNTGPIAAPSAGQPFYAQDAQLNGRQPAYRDHGNGTVTDQVTGLTWVRDPGAKVAYSAAVAGASICKVGGYTDWRLPTIKELYSLILFSGTDPSGAGTSTAGLVPFLDTRYFVFQYGNPSAGERLIDAQYWSSTPYVSTTMNGAATIFGVNFADGRIKGYPRDGVVQGKPMTEFVRYVRGGAGYGVNQLQNNGNGTISDRATGLMWAKADSGTPMTWQAALAWVQARNTAKYLGYSDWRLPNAKELQSIVDYTRSPSTTGSAAIDPLFDATAITNEGGQRDWPWYWAGTTHADSSGQGGFAVYVCFGRALGWMQQNGTGAWQLMDVHGAGAQRSDPKQGSAASYPHGHGPQGDVVRISNFVRLVRGG